MAFAFNSFPLRVTPVALAFESLHKSSVIIEIKAVMDSISVVLFIMH